MFQKVLFPTSCVKNMVQPEKPQMTIWRMRNSHRVPKATNTLSEYVILLSFPRQQLLREWASMSRFNVHCFP